MPAVPRWFWPWVAALVALYVVIAWSLRTAAVGTGGDDAVYIQLARAISHFNYRDAFLLGSPAHVKFPPGYPAFLALLSAIGGEHFQLFIAGGVLMSGLALLMFSDAMRRQTSPELATLTLLAVVANPQLLLSAGIVMSESLCLFFIAFSFWAASRDKGWWPIVAGIAACMAALTRTAAVAMPLALILAWCLQRRYRAAFSLSIAASLLIGAWLLWTVVGPKLFHSPTGEQYFSDTFLATNKSSPGLLNAIPRRIVGNSIRYVTRIIPTLLPLPHTSATILDNAAEIIAISAFGLLGIIGSWFRWRLLAIFVGGYLFLLFIWPWSVARFFGLILPFFIAVLVIGAHFVGQKMASRWKLILPALVAGVIATTGFALLPPKLEAASQCDRTAPESSPGCFNADTREFIRVARWAGNALPDSTVVAVIKEGSFRYFSGFPAVPFIRTEGASSGFMRHLSSMGVTDVVLTHISGGERKMAQKLLPDCAELTLVQRFSPTAMIIHLGPPADSAEPQESACSALSSYIAGFKTD